MGNFIVIVGNAQIENSIKIETMTSNHKDVNRDQIICLVTKKV